MINKYLIKYIKMTFHITSLSYVVLISSNIIFIILSNIFSFFFITFLNN